MAFSTGRRSSTTFRAKNNARRPLAINREETDLRRSEHVAVMAAYTSFSLSRQSWDHSPIKELRRGIGRGEKKCLLDGKKDNKAPSGVEQILL